VPQENRSADAARPQVSVVIPTRNRRLLLRRALTSALAQEGVDLETIVVDDASEDDTAAYLEGLGDRRLSVVRHGSPGGVAAARNAGLALARAPWVAFLDDDDLWAPHKLTTQLEALAAKPDSRWSCVAAIDVDEELHMLEPQLVPSGADADVVPLLLSANAIPGGGSGVLAETALVRSAGGFDEELRILADWDLWIRLALRSPLAAIDRPLVAYQRHEASMTTGMQGISEELERLEAKYTAERDARGVEFAWELWRPYIALMQRRAGLRLAPAAQYVRLAMQTRNPVVLLRAVGAMAWPPGIGSLRRRARRPVPPDWREEVERWLAPFREQASPTHRQEPLPGR
jgi:glycosyltransferase involved in cell wall biosynthesis